jgi:activating signal cointegrator complex subunit 3
VHWRSSRVDHDDLLESLTLCKFLNVPFPVESCLESRICENLNAEIACGTVSSLVDVVGYLSWTFYARRVRANPPYYGAKSSNDIDVEDFLISVAKTALSKLKESGCIDYGDKDENPGVKPLVLGQASSMYYLIFTTPKQMEFGARTCAKVVLQGLDQGEENERKRYAKGQSPLLRSARLDEMSAAWILYVLCSTHEFDEHPVRHNEEYLNEELSQKLKWGPDTTSVVSNGGAASYGPAVFQDPHTKCFLLLQAYLEHASLPISDYVNDTKTVTENIPRLLAAFHCSPPRDDGWGLRRADSGISNAPALLHSIDA